MEQKRTPKGASGAGQFAATTHAAPDVGFEATAEHRATLAEIGAATRAGIPHSSAAHVASLMKTSPAPVYEENAATLAAANGCTVENIRSIDAVFNHGEHPLSVNGTGDDLPDELTAARLTGHLVPYIGSNPDIADGAWTCTSDTGRELVLSRTEDGGFVVWNEDRDEDCSFHLETSPEHVTPESNVERRTSNPSGTHCGPWPSRTQTTTCRTGSAPGTFTNCANSPWTRTPTATPTARS